MAFRTRGLLVSGMVSALVMAVGLPLALASTPSVTQDENETPPSLVEDYSYPGADNILATKGIKLKKGDGRILLADCDLSQNQIRVMTVEDSASGRAGQYCFRTTAKTGYLTLELPRVFVLELATSERPISADLTAGGETTTVNVGAGGFQSVGEGVVGGARSTLVEIRVTG
ncbi:hypothetical protein ACH4KN_07380 [Streptomyces sp. NPDC017546]|uniref:hypothetical protein n=1 Tax=unclassified Streptomyces TaxID=2593676 RepID=UPI00235F2A71|nr:hypothetical protein [Streptomyces sp. MMBL 11-1]